MACWEAADQVDRSLGSPALEPMDLSMCGTGEGASLLSSRKSMLDWRGDPGSGHPGGRGLSGGWGGGRFLRGAPSWASALSPYAIFLACVPMPRTVPAMQRVP